MIERRRFPRFRAPDLAGRLDRDHACTVLTVSRGGMLVATGYQPDAESTIRVDVDLEGDRFRSFARVVFVGPEYEGRGGHRVALEFVATAGEDALALRDYIDTQLAPALEGRAG